MRVCQLIEALQKVNGNPHVIINGTVVQKVSEVINGRLKDGWHGPTFLPLEHGKDRAVTFEHLIEYSDGEMDYSRIWTDEGRRTR